MVGKYKTKQCVGNKVSYSEHTHTSDPEHIWDHTAGNAPNPAAPSVEAAPVVAAPDVVAAVAAAAAVEAAAVAVVSAAAEA